MKKKLSLLMVALLGCVAFATAAWRATEESGGNEGTEETMEIVVGGGSWYKAITATYPVVKNDEPATSTFADFGVDLRDDKGGIITAEEASASQTITFGITVNDGVAARVSADTKDAIAVITGKTGNNHGLQSFSAVVPVAGPVEITMSTCSWGGAVTVKDANGNDAVPMFTTKKGDSGSGCYKGNGDNDENVIKVKYTGEATTLTISGGAYVGWFSMKAINASACSVSYSLGDVECLGTILPTGGQYAIGDKYTIPAQNFTLYKEGSTLTGWTDGSKTYAAGEEITLEGDLALTPVFTQNTVSLADRTEETTIKWNFRRDQGAPVVQWQGTNGNILVAQATIGDKTIDVPMTVNTSPGKFNNATNTDWAQTNIGTKFTIPACKGAVVSMEGYSEFSTTTIDGQNDYTSGKTISYTLAGNAETVDIEIGVKPTNDSKSDCEYTRYIQVVLPVVESGGKTYTNEAAKIVWAMTDTSNPGGYVATPAEAFSTVTFTYEPATITGTANITNENAEKVLTGIKFKPATGASDVLKWNAKPAAGLTFTPTRVAGYVNRVGTDSENGITVSVYVEGSEGTATKLGTWTALRSGKTNSTTSEKNATTKAYDATAIYKYDITLTEAQQQALASSDGFYLTSTIGVGNTKEGAFGEVTIEGLINGTAADVAKYTLDIAASPAEGGSVTKYPNTDEYEEGSTIKVTATENFGYDFVNWTNEAGTEVSTDPVYQFDITQNEKLTANFKAVNTYELKLTVDGTNDYMVTVSPAGTEVEGKQMYEEGTAVQLTANQYEGLVTFTNWSDGTTDANKLITMNDNVTLTANYSETDIIAGWDFYTAGNNGRKADFAAADNDADALNLVKTDDGSTSAWLDKSTLVGGGYETFKGAAVNWRTGSSNGDVGHYHWQTKVNAEAFTDIKVQFQMMYNYNAYQTYDAEYSLDGNSWTKFGSITMSGAKAAASFSETLPAACNNQKDLYIRMIADKASAVDGSASANDGNTLAMFFITGTPKLVDDPVAPALLSSVPENNAEGASATGKIVLNFDKKVQVVEGTKATLGSQELTPAVSGKVITFSYKGLEYNTDYTFTLPANTVKNLTGATLTEAITINFKTMARPTVTKALYDKVVSTTDELVAALQAAQSRADKNVRYRIFLKKGTYTLPQGTADKTYNVELANATQASYTKKDPITYFNAQNVSIIGEDRDATIITNTIPAEDTFEGKYGPASIYEGIGNSDVFQLSGSDSYWQDLTVSTGMEDERGRDIAIEDKGTRTIWKNTKLHGYQDTWVGQNDHGLFYFEDGIIRGRTDYICGKGDAYYNRVEFQQIAGGYCAVPSRPASVGWVMKDCVINGDGEGVDGNYTLGRPWGSGTPVALWIDTKMNVVPSAIGWNEMSGGWPARFAEYNSTTKTGSVIDLSDRKKIFADTHANNPELTPAEAAEYSDMSKMFGEWEPTLLTEQAPIPQNVKFNKNDNMLFWDNSNYALLYAVCLNDNIIGFTTDNQVDVTTLEGAASAPRRAANAADYTVRAANEMGGLSEASAPATEATGIDSIEQAQPVINDGVIYTLQGVRVDKATKGVYIINGKKVVVK